MQNILQFQFIKCDHIYNLVQFPNPNVVLTCKSALTCFGVHTVIYNEIIQFALFLCSRSSSDGFFTHCSFLCFFCSLNFRNNLSLFPLDSLFCLHTQTHYPVVYTTSILCVFAILKCIFQHLQ